MLTYIFHRGINFLVKTKFLPLIPAITPTEKVISLAASTSYLVPMNSDVFLVSLAAGAAITGTSLWSLGSQVGTGYIAVISGFGTGITMWVIGHALTIPVLIIWCLLSYKKNQLRILNI